MRQHFEQYAFWLSIAAALMSLATTVAVVVYASKSISDFKLDLATIRSKDNSQDIMIQRAIDAAHEKELQCKDMLHAVNLAKRDYKYCKG